MLRAEHAGVGASDRSRRCDQDGMVDRQQPRHPARHQPERHAGRTADDGSRLRVGRRVLPFNLLRSASFRLVLGVSALYLVCFGIAACVFINVLEERLQQGIDRSIVDRHDAIRTVYEREGMSKVIELAHSRDDLPMHSAMGFHLSTPDGSRVAGNVPICITEPGWDNLTGADLGLDDTGNYRFFTAQLGNNLLSLGKSTYSLDELYSTALGSFIWTIVGSLALALLGATFMAYRTQCRVQTIARSLDRVASGHLDARLPITSSQDDIDRLAEQINDALARLQQMVESVRQVSNDIAHDLKTPLNRLYIQVEEAALLTRQGERVDDQLMAALDEARDINGTFEALLRIAQIEAGARREQFRSIGLMSILDTAVEVYAPVAEEHGQTLEFRDRVGHDLPMYGDRDLIMQLVVNLIENAIRHCPDGANIALEAQLSETGVWFCVADDGPGIPEHERDNVMRRLYRLETSRTTEGTGLGLSLVRAVADLHCGVVELEDNQPGLRVRVSFARDCPLS